MRTISRLSVPAQLTGLILIIAVAALSGWASLFMSAREQASRVGAVVMKNNTGDALLEAVRALQVERSMAMSALLSDQVVSAEKSGQITDKRKEVRANLEASRLDSSQMDEEFDRKTLTARETVESSLKALDSARREVDQAMARPKAQRNDTMISGFWRSANATIGTMQEVWLLKSVETGRIDPLIGHINQIKALAAELREVTMQDEDLLLRVFADARRLRPSEVQKMEVSRVQIETIWQLLGNLFKAHPGRFNRAWGVAQAKFITAYLDDRASLIFAAETQMPNPLDAAKLSKRVADSLDALFEISKVAMIIADERLVSEQAAVKWRMNVAVALLGLCIVVFGLTIAFAHFSIGKPISQMTAALVKLAKGETIGLADIRRSSAEITAMSGAIDVFRRRLAENEAMTLAEETNQASVVARQQRLEAAISAFERTAAGTIQGIATASAQFGQTAATLEETVGATDAVIRDVGESAQLSADNMQASAA
ncbi:MAG: hypothetical protein ACRC7G_14270, partial [Beijerinckiaceae bacterium]